MSLASNIDNNSFGYSFFSTFFSSLLSCIYFCMRVILANRLLELSCPFKLIVFSLADSPASQQNSSQIPHHSSTQKALADLE